MKKNKYIQVVVLALVLLAGTLVRVEQFPHNPPGFNQDEAASAYEAYSLAETGKDKWGNALPAYFPGWGSGQNVLLAYLTVPVVKAFGLNIFTGRLVSLVLGLLTLPLLFFCLRPLGRSPALLGTLLLAVMPWHFMLSRWALESNLVPFFMLLGCTALSRAFSTKERRWIIPALVPFGVCLYAYGTTIVVLPLFLSIVLLLGFKQIWAQRGSWLLALGLFLVVATPFLLFFAENYIASRNFPWTDSLFFSTPLLPSTRISQVAGASWMDTLRRNWGFLAASFDDGTCYNVLPGFKPLLSPTLPLAVLGLLTGAWKFGQRRGQVFSSPRTTVLALFAAWGLASLCLVPAFELNVNRFNHFYLPCLVLAVWAIDMVIRNVNSTVPRAAIRLGVVSWLALESGLAIRNYFTDYPSGPIKGQFNDGMEEAFTAVQGLWGIEQVRITNNMPLPYVYALFYLRYPPAQFQREAKFSIENGTYNVRSFGKYVFLEDELKRGQTYGYLSRRDEFPDNANQHREILFTNQGWEVGVMKVGAH